jgi:uncharacterized cofD-like protein
VQWAEDLTGQGRRESRNEVIPEASVERPTRIVCMGGGTGLPVVLRGLARKAEPKGSDPGIDLTAVVAMADDGGSSGRLRRTMGLLPPGDIRNCLVALAGARNELCEVFQHRFSTSKGLAGHAVGNLLIAALAELKGDFLEAVKVSAALLHAKGRVLPSTLRPVQLVAHLSDNTCVVGERELTRVRGKVKKVTLTPDLPPPSEGILEAIADADLITIGPGSLYSSVLPNLLVDGVAKALRETRALKVMIANMMTEPGETDGMDCQAHVRAVLDHVGHVIDVVLHNGARPEPGALEQYGRKGSAPVVADRRALLDLGVIPIEADLLKTGARIRHDGRKVARCLLKLARTGL